MALNSTQLELIKLYMASFNRAPEKGGFDYWSGQLAAGKTFAQVVDIVFNLGIVKAIYPDAMPNDAFLTLIYINIFNKLPDDEGLAYWTSQLSGGRSRSSLVLDMINAGLNTPDGTAGKTFIVNRYGVAQHAVEQQLAKGKEISIDTLKVIMGSVSDTSASVAAAKESIDNDNSGGLRAPTAPLTVPAGANGISPAEKTAGVSVVADLAGTNAVAGNIVELLINGVPFATPLNKTLAAADITAGKTTFTIPSAASWGGDGEKLITMRLKDAAGHVGPAGGGVTVVLDTTAPTAPTTALVVAAAANSISAAEKASGVDVVVALAGTNAAAGDTVEILIGALAFSVPATKVLTAADITANSATVTIPAGANWGNDGNKVLTARVKDAAGNIGAGGGSLTVVLDSTGPAGPAITIAAATNGISAAEEAAGVAVVAALGSSNAVAGDVLEILIGGASFSTPVTYTLTAADITAKAATVTIGNSAGWGSDGTKLISAKIRDAAGNLGTEGKSVSVVLDTVTPGAPGGALTSAAAAGGINAAEKTAGVAFSVDLTGGSAVVGDIVELMIDGAAFATPVVRMLTSGDVAGHSAVLTVGGTATWGADGSRVLTVRIKDAAGNASPAGGSLTVTLDTSVPTAPANALAVAVASNGISIAERNAGVDVVVDLTGSGAAVGDSVAILLGGTAFGTPVTATLNASHLTANNVTITIPGAAVWGATGDKTLTARVTDAAGNVGTAGGSLTVALDATAPGAPTSAITMAAATNGVNATERTAGVAAVVNLTGTSAAAGDTVELLLGGSPFATPVTQVLNAAHVSATNVSIAIPAGANWGSDGSKTLTARVIDVSGNVGSASTGLTLNLDTVAPAAGTPAITYTDSGTAGISAGDTFALLFNEATDGAIALGGLTLTNSHNFGSSATADWNGAKTILTVTLGGTGISIASGDVIGIVGVADTAGNTANINFTVA
ncbi:DUF4214 domain-containing protein [Noviherbaspirillum saxi]|uniref:DUF4214 domain-containing protein n=1 Tax=Noviherbaspirillum saxi TaxID=2320863 RepID=A0A3A3FYP4_9BURK|nr:DUF4214 domain-containing protein [Noviherbaspirillum saxi]RJF99321.1 DUF4214 domain-containing protein [Noviherbaspirillum saxi]